MKVGVVIPCYRVSKHIHQVIDALLLRRDVYRIVVVDDLCPEHTGKIAQEHYKQAGEKLKLVFNQANLGVGGATLIGYLTAVQMGCEILVKMDGDGQMDPDALHRLVRPILEGRADYTKGNRFFSPEMLRQMPWIRLFGNAVLSFFNKASSGYWDIMDSTNGYTAIHANVFRRLPANKINSRYFFESDMLFRLGTMRAMVKDIPIPARYGDEQSNMSIGKIALSFPLLHLRCLVKRIGYLYFLRDLNPGSLQLSLTVPLMAFGILFGGYEWIEHAGRGIEASSGTVMLAALPLIIGFQLFLGFLLFDVGNVPKEPIYPLLADD